MDTTLIICSAAIKKPETYLRAAVAVVLLLAMSAAAPVGADELEWIYQPVGPIELTSPELPQNPIQLILDDDTPEGVFGVGIQNAQQFLWFNRFSNPGDFQLEEIWVLFPGTVGMTVGAEVQLAVYRDPDGDPINGAGLLATSTEVIQSVNGDVFSVYPLNPPLTITGSGDILIGVIDRFVESGVTPPTTPAALDTTASQGRSWLAVWTNDPPDPPLLPPDGVYSTVDPFQPGNWMIRGFGTSYQIPAVPVIDWRGIAFLVLLMAAAGWSVARSLR